MSSPSLQKNILATIAYYDEMDYPLTGFEIYKYLISLNNLPRRQAGKQLTTDNDAFSLANVKRELDEYNLKRFIEEYRGFYFLKGRKSLVDQRIKRNKISVAKIKKLRRVTSLLRFIPFIRMIGVTGALAMKNADKESDWDVLVVTKGGKIWTGRTLITIFTQLLGKRRHNGKIKDRVCLNYFITDKSLNLITKDLFSAHEYFFTYPFFDTDIFRKFQLQNSWIRNYKPNYYLREVEGVGEIEVIRGIREIGERIFIFDFLEKWLGNWQRRKIMKNPLTKKAGSFIRAEDERLIFLPEPHGPELERNMNEKMKKFFL